MITIPLKLKYLNPSGKLVHRNQIDPPEGTWVFNAGRFTGKTNNSGKASKTKSVAPRRRAYGPW